MLDFIEQRVEPLQPVTGALLEGREPLTRQDQAGFVPVMHRPPPRVTTKVFSTPTIPTTSSIPFLVRGRFTIPSSSGS